MNPLRRESRRVMDPFQQIVAVAQSLKQFQDMHEPVVRPKTSKQQLSRFREGIRRMTARLIKIIPILKAGFGMIDHRLGYSRTGQ
ncbi:hypothetical protein Tco_0087472 [Tanacetum coccineum]